MEHDDITYLNVDKQNIYLLSSLPSRLVELYCGNNNLSRLPALPHTLRALNCPHNRLSKLPELPALTVLDITANHIVSFRVPETLNKLYCSFNPGLKLSLPNALKELHCCNNGLTSLMLPQVEIVYCSHNKLTTVALPEGLKQFYCDQNSLKRLELPASLQILDCVDNQLTALALPPGLQELNCSYNQITSITLNKALIHVNLSANPIVSVPTLHRGIVFLNMNHTLIEKCFDFAPNVGLYFYGTPLYTKMNAVLPTKTRILDPNMIRLSFEIITMIEDRFKELYYGCKIKSRMMTWMWNARENIARRKYHPDELWKFIHDYEVLDRWD